MTEQLECNIQILRLISGEELMGEIIDASGTARDLFNRPAITIKEPVSLAYSGQAGILMKMWGNLSNASLFNIPLGNIQTIVGAPRPHVSEYYLSFIDYQREQQKIYDEESRRATMTEKDVKNEVDAQLAKIFNSNNTPDGTLH